MIDRNWSEICTIGTNGNRLLMAVLASVDTTSDVGKRLATVFPECFEPKKKKGPIPLSFLKEESKKRTKDDDNHPFQWRGCDIIKDFSLPALVFCYASGYGRDEGAEDLPFDLTSVEFTDAMMRDERGQGKVITWKDTKFLIVENVCGHITLVPVSCIDMKL